jgi:hypothetical protein
MFSETVTDLANELLLCKDCDPSQLHNPETPIPRIFHNSLQLAQSLGTLVTIPLSSMVQADGFIDDLICMFLDSEENQSQAPHAVPLTMHVTNQPHAGNGVEPIKFQNILSSMPKLEAEGTPDE